MRSAIPLRIVCQAALMAGMTLIPRSAYAYDYIKNGGFEDGCTPDTQDCKYWYFTGNAGVNKVPHSDKYGANVGGEGDGHGEVYQPLKLKKGRYTLSFWYTTIFGAGHTPVSVKIGDKTVFSTVLGPDVTWFNYVFSDIYFVEDPPGDTRITFHAEDQTGQYAGPFFRIDDVSLEGPAP
jgi:hypothetical protein